MPSAIGKMRMNRRSAPRLVRRAMTLILSAALVAGAATALAKVADAAGSSHDPYGSLDLVQQTGTGLHVTGWATDIDNHLPLTVSVTVNGTQRARVTAGVLRPDLAARLGSGNLLHGFDVNLALAAGPANVCVRAVNRGLGSDATIGCRAVVVSFSPRGSLDSLVQISGGFRIVGGAADPNTSAAINVDILMDGVVQRRILASNPLHQGHGYRGDFLVPAGLHTVCVKGINVGAGSDAIIRCRPISLNYGPVGAIDALTSSPGGFTIAGWATDPDTTAAIGVTVTVNGAPLQTLAANLPSSSHPGHGFRATMLVAGGKPVPGTYRVCALGINAGRYGSDQNVACRNVVLDFNPKAAIDGLVQVPTGARVSGWAVDPDSGAALSTVIQADGRTVATVIAGGGGTPHTLHRFTASVPLGNGRHTICAIGKNVLYGSGDSAPACAAITLNFNPVGAYSAATRTATQAVAVTGWAIDPNTADPINVSVTIDATAAGQLKANVVRSDVTTAYPGFGSAHGFAGSFATSDGEHRVCVTALNVGTGSNTSLGCRIVNAVHPTVPSAPTAVTGVAAYGAVTLSWTAPASDGGAPWSSYTVTTSPATVSTTVAGNRTSVTVGGLKSHTTYRFYVVATNVAGRSPAGVSPLITTLSTPPPQTTPAPISTSRYIRNITGGSSIDLAKLRAEGAADAKANPSGHTYLVLLDIGGQDQADGGVVLSAMTRFISYGDLVKNVKAYVDGYASQQKPSAPITIAIGTNNDMDVSAAAGATWARAVVNPVTSYASKYLGIRIAAANDIEPGFSASYSATKAWLSGYLGATSVPFVFNGSADGCAWTVTNRACNNGWSMAGLYYLAAGASPSRIVNLPQIYNNTMAAQWKYISLTGVTQSHPRINFGGALTEWTACAQTGSCGSLTGNSAWTQMWNQLQSHPALRIASLPYSTDLRIDR